MKRCLRAPIACAAAVAVCSLPGTAIAGTADEPAGTYKCFKAESSKPTKTLVLNADGTYAYGDGAGTYVYKAARQRVKFTAGPLTKFYGVRVFDVNGGVDLYDKDKRKRRQLCFDASQEPEI